jgi:hypothetical protein
MYPRRRLVVELGSRHRAVAIEMALVKPFRELKRACSAGRVRPNRRRSSVSEGHLEQFDILSRQPLQNGGLAASVPTQCRSNH